MCLSFEAGSVGAGELVVRAEGARREPPGVGILEGARRPEAGILSATTCHTAGSVTAYTQLDVLSVGLPTSAWCGRLTSNLCF